jgi:hypothetical protein
MKYTITFIFLSLLLTGCGRRDAKIQRELTGTWVVDSGVGISDRTVIHSDGSFECQETGYTNGSVVSFEGTLLAKDGELVETVTKHSQKGTPVPFVLHIHIIRFDGHELVWKWDRAASESVARKVEP